MCRTSIATIAAISILAICASLPGQRTWTVDPGGNGDHKTITDAIRASTSGDRILVGPGTYSETPRITKTLTLLGYGAIVDGVVVENLQAVDQCVLSGFEMAKGKAIALKSNRGHVAVTGCVAISYLFDLPRGLALIVEDCEHVTVHGCIFRDTGAQVTKSNVSFTQSTLDGADGSRSLIGNHDSEPGLSVTSSHVVLGDVEVRGGRGLGFPAGLWPKPAISIQASVVIVGVESELYAGRPGVGMFSSFAPAVQGDAATKLYADPTVRAEASDISIPIVIGTTPILLVLPTQKAEVKRRANRDFVLESEIVARPNWTAGLLIGLPGPRLTVPMIGDLWLDTTQPILIIDIGRTANDARRRVAVPLPAALLEGTRVTLQSLLLHADGKTLQLSTPVTVVLR